MNDYLGTSEATYNNPVLLNAMREIGLEDDERVYGALAIGYADSEDGLPIRRPLDRTGNIVTYV